MIRLVVAGGFLIVAGVMLWLGFFFDDPTTANVFINLGTETIGIVLTVAVVESFMERRRVLSKGRQLAWDTLHAAETAVWVWQGGPREMETDEMLGILNAVDEDDPLPDFTEGLFLNLGTRSRRLLNNDRQAVGSLPGFMNGLEELARLSALRDGKTRMSPRKVADILEAGTKGLARALNQPTERHLASLIRFRDPSLESQERRHHGGRGSLGWQSPGTDLDL